MTNYMVHPDDLLWKLHGNTGGEILLDRLFDGSSEKGEKGQLISCWKQHLGLGSDEELRELLSSLRLIANSATFNQINEQLNDRLLLAGLQSIDDTTIISPYDDLARKFIQNRQIFFTREKLETIVQQEGLRIREPLQHVSSDYTLGLRSFTRWADNLEDVTHGLLDLTRYFEGRTIRNTESWVSDILPEIERFFSKTLAGKSTAHLRMDAHYTIGFLAGYCVDPKSGIRIYPVQKGRSGTQIWSPDDGPQPTPPLWEIKEKTVGAGSELAIAFSVTREISQAVETYIKQTNPKIGRIVFLRIFPSSSSLAVQGGRHANLLAEEAIRIIHSQKDQIAHQVTTHLFWAAPISFVFLLGQLARSIGPCQLYEHNFDGEWDTPYTPTLLFSNRS
jgi:hypothetical protein